MKEMKDDISIVKLNISNLHKTVIPWIKHTKTLKNRSYILLLIIIKSVICITRLMRK